MHQIYMPVVFLDLGNAQSLRMSKSVDYKIDLSQ